jgi:non-homologous end joining protein Ku
MDYITEAYQLLKEASKRAAVRVISKSLVSKRAAVAVIRVFWVLFFFGN